MQNRDSDLDVQPEDWERQSSEPADLEMEYRVDKVRVDERIKAIQIQLIRNGERMTRIEKGIENIKSDFKKDIERVEGNHSQLVKYLWGGIALIFTAAVTIIVALINRGN